MDALLPLCFFLYLYFMRNRRQRSDEVELIPAQDKDGYNVYVDGKFIKFMSNRKEGVKGLGSSDEQRKSRRTDRKNNKTGSG